MNLVHTHARLLQGPLQFTPDYAPIPEFHSSSARYGCHYHVIDAHSLCCCLCSQHHAATNAVDSIKGKQVADLPLAQQLLEAVMISTWSYSPSKEELIEASGFPEEDIIMMDPTTEPNRPAYTFAFDHKHKRVLWGFRGTTDLHVSKLRSD